MALSDGISIRGGVMSGVTTEKWLCTGCHFLLGFVENKTIVRIKRKDLYIQVKGGEVWVNCCRCGKVNNLQDFPEHRQNP